MPTLLVIGVLVLIVLVLITGITLTNTINVHNIIKLNEKVVSDSVANSQESKETRDIYMTRHPKNLNKTVIIRLEVDNTSAKYDRLIANTDVGVDVDLLTTVSTIGDDGVDAASTTIVINNVSSGGNVSADIVSLSIMEKNYTLIDNEKREHIKQVSLCVKSEKFQCQFQPSFSFCFNATFLKINFSTGTIYFILDFVFRMVRELSF